MDALADDAEDTTAESVVKSVDGGCDVSCEKIERASYLTVRCVVTKVGDCMNVVETSVSV